MPLKRKEKNPSRPPVFWFCKISVKKKKNRFWKISFSSISCSSLATSRCCSCPCSPAASDLLVCAHLPGLLPSPCPPYYLLSQCEYFALLLPLVRDAWDWVLIVFPWCGHGGMRLPDVWCVMTGVWLLTPSRPPACLPVRLHLTSGDMAAPTHAVTHSRLLHTGVRDTVTACAFFLMFFAQTALNTTSEKVLVKLSMCNMYICHSKTFW